MSYLFLNKDFVPGFDSDISGWNVGSVTNMNWMFKVRIIICMIIYVKKSIIFTLMYKV